MSVNEKDPIDLFKAKAILKPLESKEELRAWFTVYFGLEFPMGYVDEKSNSCPTSAMWRIYELYATGQSAEVSQVVLLSSRDSFKTLAASAIEVLCMLHFTFCVAHGSAVRSQSEKAIQYVNSFFRKISKYLEYNGWKKISDSKSKIEWVTDKDETVYIRVLVATLAGMNCVSPDSKLITEDGEKTAKEIYTLIDNGKEVKVLSYNHKTEKKEFKKILHQEKKVHEKKYKITTKTGVVSTTSGDHEFFVNNKDYVKMEDIKVNDTLSEINPELELIDRTP